MSTCAECRFWGTQKREFWREGADDYVQLPQRNCLKIIHGNGSPASAAETTPAYVADGSGYAATLFTLATFGCSLFETKS